MAEDRARTAALAAAQSGVVSAAQFRASGLGDSGIAHRVRVRRLFRVRRGVYALSPYVDVWGQRWAALLAVDPVGALGAVLSHRSAAEAHGITAATGSLVEVTVSGDSRRVAAGVRVHRARSLRRSDTTLVRGLPVTSTPRTVLDLAGTEGDDAVRRVIREAEYLGRLPAGAMRAAIRDRGGHPGVARIRRVDPATHEADLMQTPLEDELAALVRCLPLPPPVAQMSIATSTGARYRPDFAWPRWRLIAEADGRAAHVRALSLESDRARDADLAADGWLTLRFTRTQVLTDASAVEDRLLRTAFVRGWIPGREARRGPPAVGRRRTALVGAVPDAEPLRQR